MTILASEGKSGLILADNSATEATMRDAGNAMIADLSGVCVMLGSWFKLIPAARSRDVTGC